MLSNIRKVTYDFIENERGLFGERQSVNNCDKDQYIQEVVSRSIEAINTEVIKQNELSQAEYIPRASEISIILDSRTDLTGESPKRYTTKCYLEPKAVPYWYNENLLLFINSTKRIYEEKVYFKEKFLPIKWSERMWTEANYSNHPLKISTLDIPLTDIYIPLNEVQAC
ncbi:uncharacterized protein LOC130893792 [Diorhabda carinulata]|uniref:uncharacterized protein LOC130893792 n=1 Tax=Diorhabda carinulata TaxID=1163345 RepID=UPI0025A01A23|nr:uncharacterized protein LOC130893792 [Diorhabda carinulata]